MTSLLNIAGNIPVVAEAGGQSLRFDDADNAYLSFTPASAGNQDVWTFSAWVKRGKIDSAYYGTIFGAGIATSDRLLFRFGADGLSVFWRDLNTTNRYLTSNAVFRDGAGWYHIVLAVDVSQATTANRMRMYVNNEEITSFSSDSRGVLSSGSSLAVNSAALHTLGTRAYSVGNGNWDGYIANVTFIDGTQLTPSSFGEYDGTLWKPKPDDDITGNLTFGTNGFYLNFEDNSAIGDDTSGNANDWTVNNLLSTDVVLDSPVTGGNFATLNAVTERASTYSTLSEGNLKVATSTSGRGTRFSTIAIPSGSKAYAEFKGISLTGHARVGVISADEAANYQETATFDVTAGCSYTNVNGVVTLNNASQGTFSTWAAGDIIGVAVDLSGGSVSFYKNNTLITTVTNSLFDSGDFMFAVSDSSTSAASTLMVNFGQDSSFVGTETPQGNGADGEDFYYAPPSGHLALKTSLLPTPDIADPTEYFNTLLYTGNGSTQAITGANHQPDWVWIKERPVASAHAIYDSVRGNTEVLSSNTTGAGYDQSADAGLESFDTDGFTVDYPNTGDYYVNRSGQSYVAWSWAAGGTAVSNTDGSITSQVSANTDAGFSIATYTGTGSATNFGHGLSQAPDMVIIKNRDATAHWPVWHKDLGGANYYLYLSATVATGPYTPFFPSAPTSTVVNIGTDVYVNHANDYVAYCFHSVEGYSKIGSYTGNGNADGPFVYCGFRPAFLIYKSSTSGESWGIRDNTRDPYNEADALLYPSSSASEASSAGIDFTANGFKIRNSTNHMNTSGQTYIFYAVAEAPFSKANAR